MCVDEMYDDCDMIYVNDDEMSSDVWDNASNYDVSSCMTDGKGNGVRDEVSVLYPVIFPVFLHGQEETPIKALWDTDNFSMLIINEKLIPENSVMYQKRVVCSGIFQDGKTRR